MAVKARYGWLPWDLSLAEFLPSNLEFSVLCAIWYRDISSISNIMYIIVSYNYVV